MNTNNLTGFCGWDIGGAHLKIARCDQRGQLQQVIQIPCALWRGIEELETAMLQAVSLLNCQHDQHAITMTGELVDAFENRQQGVEKILDCIAGILPKASSHIFAGKRGWLTTQQAKVEWRSVASMNWQASAILAATHCNQGLFLDIGSTTCDIIPIINHEIQPEGLDDHHRQRSGELVYSGAIRTPLFTISGHAPLNGAHIPLAAEWFASSGDIWTLLGKLSETDIQDISADAKPWTEKHCRQRLARMLATDAMDASESQWQLVADWFADQQVQQISQACYQVLSKQVHITNEAPLIGAGVGRFIIKALAERMNRPYIDFSNFCQNLDAAAAHAPAAALALLAQQQLT